MGANILKDIFFDDHQHWERFVKKYGNRIRPNVLKEVEKFRQCGDPKNGFKVFVCDVCQDVKIVAYRCKGRFCTSCFAGETEEWSRLLVEDVFQVNHRHVIFTIDEGLRIIFQKHRELLKPLMDEAAGLILGYFKKHCKVTAGVIVGLHTFGARIQFNPHVHMLVTMGGMKRNGEWKVYDYIPFEMLRKQWQTVVLKLIRKHLSASEKQEAQPLLQKAYKNNGEGFYIYAPKFRGSAKMLLGYIGRYMRRPAIALHRIESYDGTHVTFRYHDKEDNRDKQETLSVEDFIARLIVHIPEEQFKMIRHYGVYSRRTKKLSRALVSAWQLEVRRWIIKAKRTLQRRTWGQRIEAQTGINPMQCRVCGDQYVYKGEVCLDDSELTIKKAYGDKTRAFMERMIAHLTGIEGPKKECGRQKVQEKEPTYRQVRLFELPEERRYPMEGGARV